MVGIYLVDENCRRHLLDPKQGRKQQHDTWGINYISTSSRSPTGQFDPVNIDIQYTIPLALDPSDIYTRVHINNLFPPTIPFFDNTTHLLPSRRIPLLPTLLSSSTQSRRRPLSLPPLLPLDLPNLSILLTIRKEINPVLTHISLILLLPLSSPSPPLIPDQRKTHQCFNAS